MIPADLTSRTQIAAETALRPVAPTQQITDKLADLVPGQRLMAEIQALLPNGTYRAMIAQRNVTLALPFTAKAGDSLELEVVESDGKLALAVLSRPPGEAGGKTGDAVAATLSRTGQLISSLFAGRREAQGEGGSQALPLNGNRPIAEAPPTSARDILPLLRQAITQSGMFYEAHQAEWVEGRLDKTALFQEPQGKLSPQLQLASDASQSPRGPERAPAGSAETAAQARPAVLRGDAGEDAGSRTGSAANAAGTATTPGQPVAREAMPVVQQQLEALATQQFAWQGQVWPGQQMRWEIEEDAQQPSREEDTPAGWQTRLHLALPRLGELEARIRLEGSRIHLDMQAASEETQAMLREALVGLRQQLDDAGLALASAGIGGLATAPIPPAPPAPSTMNEHAAPDA